MGLYDLTETQKKEYAANNKAGIDTKGQLILRSNDKGYLIAIDDGLRTDTCWYLNVRYLKDQIHLEHLSWCTPSVSAITSNLEREYGTAWGSGGALFKITESEKEELLKENEAIEKAEAERLDEELNRPVAKHGVGWCNRCQSYCFGDCTAA